jgi:hypothetical protein
MNGRDFSIGLSRHLAGRKSLALAIEKLVRAAVNMTGEKEWVI